LLVLLVTPVESRREPRTPPAGPRDHRRLAQQTLPAGKKLRMSVRLRDLPERQVFREPDRAEVLLAASQQREKRPAAQVRLARPLRIPRRDAGPLQRFADE